MTNESGVWFLICDASVCASSSVTGLGWILLDEHGLVGLAGCWLEQGKLSWEDASARVVLRGLLHSSIYEVSALSVCSDSVAVLGSWKPERVILTVFFQFCIDICGKYRVSILIEFLFAIGPNKFLLLLLGLQKPL